MNKTKKDKIADAFFLIALALVVSGLIINILISGKPAEAANEPTTAATTAETEKPTQEPTETEPQETTPPVTLYDVPLDYDLQLHIISEAIEHDIDPAIIFAMAFRESTYRTDAVGDGGKSFGLLQVQPRWHYDRMLKLDCTDLLDPFQNVTVAVDYLAEKLDNHGGDLAKALTAYNKGHFPGYVTEYARDVMSTAEGLRGETYAVYQN